jgi:hypothetical protein
MSQKLPVRNYKWLTDEELDVVRVDPLKFLESIGENSEIGYFFEVDLSVPVEIHQKLDEYPPAPIKRAVREDELSEYQLEQKEVLGLSDNIFKTKKLICDLNPKKDYVTHYKLLKKYLELGLKVDIVHKGVSFTQSAWMKPYITFNTERRKAATSDYDVKMCKDCNNCSYGNSLFQYENK